MTDLPPFRKGITVSMGEPLRRFEIRKKKVTDQAYCMRDGKFYYDYKQLKDGKKKDLPGLKSYLLSL